MVPPVDLIASASETLVAPLLISIVGSGGVMGAIVAFVKLRGDRDSAAVHQAQGAADALERALEASEREVAYWKARYDACHKRANELAAELLTRRGGETS